MRGSKFTRCQTERPISSFLLDTHLLKSKIERETHHPSRSANTRTSRHIDAHELYPRAPSPTEVCIRAPACSSAPAKVVVAASVVTAAVGYYLGSNSRVQAKTQSTHQTTNARTSPHMEPRALRVRTERLCTRWCGSGSLRRNSCAGCTRKSPNCACCSVGVR